MTATLSPFGLATDGNIGGKFKGSLNVYPLVSQSTSLGLNDPLSPASGDGTTTARTGSGVGPGLVPSDASATAQCAGTLLGVEYIDSQGIYQTSQYWAANTTVYANSRVYVTVNDDPYSTFAIQCNATLTNPAVHKNYNFVPPATNAPSAITKNSTVSLNVSTYSQSSARSLRIIGLAPKSLVSNDWNDLYPIVLVVINNHAYRAPVAGL